jgi:hypothetical protein
MSEVTESHPLRTGKSRLDGTAVLGTRYESNASGFLVELHADEETDARGNEWPPVVQGRLKSVLSKLASSRLRLVVKLTVMSPRRWARLDPHGFLGFERLRGEASTGYRMTIYDGNTGDSDTTGFRPLPAKPSEAK